MKLQDGNHLDSHNTNASNNNLFSCILFERDINEKWKDDFLKKSSPLIIKNQNSYSQRFQKV